MSESYDVPTSFSPRIPRAFIERRLQSLTGLFLVLFLLQHLFVNSQTALFFGDDPGSFIRMANYLRSLPYLPALEILLLGVPFFLHTWWGIHRLYTSQLNSFPTDGSTPHLEYPRNRAYTWQRITSILLIVGVIWHVASMRFIDAPKEVEQGLQDTYYIKLSQDAGLDTVADRLDVALYDVRGLNKLEKQLQENIARAEREQESSDVIQQRVATIERLMNALRAQALQSGEVVAITKSGGTAVLLMVRETFKSPLICLLYSLFVVAAVFHATNGLWTFCITWGILVTERSRLYARTLSHALFLLLLLFGLASIWGTYFIALRE